MIVGKLKNKLGRPSKKVVKRIIIGLIAAVIIAGAGYFILGGKNSVGFTALEENQIPQQIVSDVIPEYRQLERALACVVDGKVYVIATRGEKPTSGYGITIDKMYLEKEGETTNLVVCAIFKDPQAGMSLTQALTYPLQVTETDLEALPDTIQLKVQYE